MSLPGYTHSRCFEEVAISLQAAFHELGYARPPVIYRFSDIPEGTVPVILGGHLLMGPVDFPDGVVPVFFNLEQLEGPPPDKECIERFRGTFERFILWDYSQKNIALLASLGIRAKHCGIGYSPALSKIKHEHDEDIDILFYGSMNDRRKRLVDTLKRTGINVVTLFDKYGKERDGYIARSKVILNVHFYESKIFEIVRCSYLMANRKCIVSESGLDTGLEDRYRDGIAFAGYDDIVPTCLELLGDKPKRSFIAERGFEIFSKQSQADFLRKALDE